MTAAAGAAATSAAAVAAATAEPPALPLGSDPNHEDDVELSGASSLLHCLAR